MVCRRWRNGFDAQNIPLTPQIILWLCQKRITQMDRDIRQEMMAIDGTHARSKELSAQIEALQQLKSQLRENGYAYSDGKIDVNKINDHNDACDTMREALDLPQDDDDAIMRGYFADAMERYDITYSPDESSFNLACIDDKIEMLRNEQQTINSGNEMKMMWLQDQMQRRTQTLQAGSNFLASINDATKTIVGNLR